MKPLVRHHRRTLRTMCRESGLQVRYDCIMGDSDVVAGLNEAYTDASAPILRRNWLFAVCLSIVVGENDPLRYTREMDEIWG